MKSTQLLQRMHRIMAHADKIGRQAEAPLFDMANAVKNGDLEAMDRIVNDFQTAHHDCAEAARALCLLEALAPRLPLTEPVRKAVEPWVARQRPNPIDVASLYVRDLRLSVNEDNAYRAHGPLTWLLEQDNAWHVLWPSLTRVAMKNASHPVGQGVLERLLAIDNPSPDAGFNAFAHALWDTDPAESNLRAFEAMEKTWTLEERQRHCAHQMTAPSDRFEPLRENKRFVALAGRGWMDVPTLRGLCETFSKWGQMHNLTSSPP